MSAKVYNQTAEIIREQVDVSRAEAGEGYKSEPVDRVVINNAYAAIGVLKELSDRFAGEYQANNVNFDHDKFMSSCGFPVNRQ